MNEQQVKKPFQSKTILINSIIGLCMALSPFIPQLSIVKTFIEANAIMIGTVWSVLNIILRSISKDKIVLSE